MEAVYTSDGSIPFLDTKVTPGPNNAILTTVYWKPTHTDQYLHLDSNHFITAKNSVYNTLAHRAKVVSSTPGDLTQELDHLKKAFMACQFPNWALNRLQQQLQLKQTQQQQHPNKGPNQQQQRENNSSQQNKTISIVIPYIQGLGEKFKRTCKKQGIQVHFKGTNKVKQLLMAPKDRTPN